jgi:hypothetical protein
MFFVSSLTVGVSLSTTHAESLKLLMTLNFQRFEDILLMAA